MGATQGFTVENGADRETAFAFAAEAGFDYLEPNVDHQFDRRRVEPGQVRELTERYGLELAVHLPYRVDVGTPLTPVREHLFGSVERVCTVGTTGSRAVSRT
jgi:sugar phosphate isomerase/epimerase